jgi:hypothetical protein
VQAGYQRSSYTCTPRWGGELVRIAIPRQHCDDLSAELRTLGIDRASLFPGLDGVVQSIRARLGVQG